MSSQVKHLITCVSLNFGLLFMSFIFSTFLVISHYDYSQEAITGCFIFSALIVAPLGYGQGLRMYRDHKGYARWLTINEAKREGRLDSKGVILGEKWGSYFRAPGWEHVLCFAPSGTGKTTSLVIPNLLTWGDSCVVLDIKQELFDKTSGFREKSGSKCYKFNPGAINSNTHRYNPLNFLSSNTKIRVNQIQKLGLQFFPDRGSDPLWVAGPRNLFVAATLYILYADGKPSFGKILRLLKSCDFDELAQDCIDNGNLIESCRNNFSEFVSYPDKTRASIKASTVAGLNMFESPLIDEATSCSDFDISMLRKKNMSIYIVVSNDDLLMLAPLINIFFQQVLNVLTHKEPSAIEPYGVLIILDEFTAIGKIDSLKVNIGLLRSYRVRLMMVVQDISQLYDTYGHHGAKSFINVKTRVSFSQNSLETAEYISKVLGTKTNHAFQRGKNVPVEPLLSAQQLLGLDESKALVLIEGSHPVMLKKIKWYKHKQMAKRVFAPAMIKRSICE